MRNFRPFSSVLSWSSNMTDQFRHVSVSRNALPSRFWHCVAVSVEQLYILSRRTFLSTDELHITIDLEKVLSFDWCVQLIAAPEFPVAGHLTHSTHNAHPLLSESSSNWHLLKLNINISWNASHLSIEINRYLRLKNVAHTTHIHSIYLSSHIEPDRTRTMCLRLLPAES